MLTVAILRTNRVQHFPRLGNTQMAEEGRDHEHEALMQRFLAAVEGYSNEEAGSKIGMTGEAIRKYRRGDWKRLEKATARKMRAFLRDVPAPDRDGYRQGLLAAADEMAKKVEELRDLAATPSAEDVRVLEASALPEGDDGRDEEGA